MAGATAISFASGGIGAALVPLIVGALATSVALGRRTWAAHRPAPGPAVFQPAR